MKTLDERFKNSDRTRDNISRINPEEIVDVAYCLCTAVNDRKLILASPECISIKDDGSVKIDTTNGVNMYYASPEVILGRKKPDSKSAWFTLGLLIYFVIHGRSYYDDRSLNIVNMTELQTNGQGLIDTDNVSENTEDIPGLLRLAMNRFTRWNPDMREEGAKFLLKAVQKYSSTAEVRYLYGNKEVYFERLNITSGSVQCPHSLVLRGNDGKDYRAVRKMKIPFRPGVHKYNMHVDLASGGHVLHTTALAEYIGMTIDSKPEKIRLMKIDDENTSKRIFIKLNVPHQFDFYHLVVDSATDQIKSTTHKYQLMTPRSTTRTDAAIVVELNSRKCRLCLFDKEVENQISKTVNEFSV